MPLSVTSGKINRLLRPIWFDSFDISKTVKMNMRTMAWKLLKFIGFAANRLNDQLRFFLYDLENIIGNVRRIPIHREIETSINCTSAEEQRV